MSRLFTKTLWAIYWRPYNLALITKGRNTEPCSKWPMGMRALPENQGHSRLQENFFCKCNIIWAAKKNESLISEPDTQIVGISAFRKDTSIVPQKHVVVMMQKKCTSVIETPNQTTLLHYYYTHIRTAGFFFGSICASGCMCLWISQQF